MFLKNAVSDLASLKQISGYARGLESRHPRVGIEWFEETCL